MIRRSLKFAPRESKLNYPKKQNGRKGTRRGNAATLILA
jgi:hypothetical protein